jgi:class 3 adenylate cyclase
MIPDTRYAKSPDGVHIAYQVLGTSPIDLVLAPGFVSHVEHSWEDPALARFLRRLASFSRLVVFDKRGTGMSDRIPDDHPPLLEDRVGDIVAVMEAAGSDRAALMGVSETGPMTLLFAATYPERTRALVEYGTFTGGVDKPAYPWAPTTDESEWLDHLERNWGRGAMFLDDIVPSLVGDKRHEQWFAKLERLAASPGAAVALARMAFQTDVRDILPTIRVPALVLHRKDDRTVPVDEGRYLAQRIPGATFVELAGADHWPWVGDSESVVEEIEEFLTGARGRAEPDRVLTTVMFVDIVESTKRGAELGDRRWADLLQTFYAVVRRELHRSRGREIDTAGDGFFMTFDGPARAIRCAKEINEAVTTLGLQVRAGIHTGECERIGNKVAGLSVVIGSRVTDLAGPGEVLVSSTVKDLVAGSDLAFEDAGEHELKGVPDRWHLYRVID